MKRWSFVASCCTLDRDAFHGASRSSKRPALGPPTPLRSAWNQFILYRRISTSTVSVPSSMPMTCLLRPCHAIPWLMYCLWTFVFSSIHTTGGKSSCFCSCCATGQFAARCCLIHSGNNLIRLGGSSAFPGQLGRLWLVLPAALCPWQLMFIADPGSVPDGTMCVRKVGGAPSRDWSR
jgi:hypothetical protein